MAKMTFVERYISEEYWHWKYQFAFADSAETVDEYKDRQTKLYNWCFDNLNDIGGWFILDAGVIIFKVDDAMAFKLRWI